LFRYIEQENRCYIYIDKEFLESDIETLAALFLKKYEYYEMSISYFYTLSAKLIKMISYYQKRVKLTIHTDNTRLARYLHAFLIDALYVTDKYIHKAYLNVNADMIVIGGSAKSSQHIVRLLKSIHLENYSIVIVQHIANKDLLSLQTILQRNIDASVVYAQEGELLQKNHIYLAPKDHHLKISKERFCLEDGDLINGAKPSISVTFNSFSKMYKERLIAILECGYVNDGVDALEYMQSKGSIVIVQDPNECFDADEIPKKAISTHHYNYVFNLEKMCYFFEVLSKCIDSLHYLDYLLEEIYKLYEYDYRSYDRNMLQRRVELFMIKYSIHNIKQFLILVLFHKRFFKLFFLELSINVSEFFRNPKDLANLILLLPSLKNNYRIKLWCAGVSNGKEAYSLAIILDSLGMLDKSLIYATDFNPVVIDEAKNGLYGLKKYQKAQSNFDKLNLSFDLQKYFIEHEDFVEVKEHIKKKVMFFVHNLQCDGSFNEFDLIICRNVLIYFSIVLQEKVFGLIYDSLKFGGLLFLGSNEFVPTAYEDKFAVCSPESKILKKVR